MSLKEFAVHIGVSYSTVRRMVANQTIRVVKPHRRAMIPENETAKFDFTPDKNIEDLKTGT
jgi:excisionase family DNA binding protein